MSRRSNSCDGYSSEGPIIEIRIGAIRVLTPHHVMTSNSTASSHRERVPIWWLAFRHVLRSKFAAARGRFLCLHEALPSSTRWYAIWVQSQSINCNTLAGLCECCSWLRIRGYRTGEPEHQMAAIRCRFVGTRCPPRLFAYSAIVSVVEGLMCSLRSSAAGLVPQYHRVCNH